MKKIWVRVDPWNKKMATTALEGGAAGIMVPDGYSAKAKALGRTTTISKDGDLKPDKDITAFTITGGEDEQEIVKLSQTRKVILECSDWTVIPLENLIAKRADIIVKVHTLEEARTAFGVLERGVREILFCPADTAQLKKALEELQTVEDTTKLSEAEIIQIKPVGMGDRVCVDTCTAMQPGQGMLVGNSSSALFLVHAESIDNPYVAPRPFRVNAGPVHAYTRVQGGKTRYLSELAAGDTVILVDYTGASVPATVGRLKIEKRPLMLVTAEVKGKQVTTILQNAETIRLTLSDGRPISIVGLAPGDKVLVALESGGRHFGHKIEETITEK